MLYSRKSYYPYRTYFNFYKTILNWFSDGNMLLNVKDEEQPDINPRCVKRKRKPDSTSKQGRIINKNLNKII